MKKSRGLLALLGLGAFAFWKYKNMSPDEKDKVKGKINEAKRKFSDATSDLKDSLDNKISQAKAELNDLKDQARKEAENVAEEAKNS